MATITQADQYFIITGGGPITLTHNTSSTAISAELYYSSRIISMYVSNVSSTKSYNFIAQKTDRLSESNTQTVSFFACKLKPLETVRIITRANPIVLETLESVFFKIQTLNGDTTSGSDIEYYYACERWRL